MARMTKSEKEIYLKQRLVEMQEYENDLKEKGYRFIAGVDEVGRGPLAGPVATLKIPHLVRQIVRNVQLFLRQSVKVFVILK